MRFFYIVIISFVLTINVVYCDDILFDKPIDFIPRKEYSFDEFCKEFVEDIDIEKFIKKELNEDYTVVSLDECIDIALKNNFDISIKEKNYLSNKYEYHNALSKFLPMFMTTSYLSDYGGQILVGGVLRDVIHETAISVNLTVQHQLFQGGRQIFEAKAKKYFMKASKSSFASTKNYTIYLVVKNYYELLKAKLDIEIYLKNLVERNIQTKFATNLVKYNNGFQFDVVRSKKEASEAKMCLLNALNLFRKSQAELANIMGIDVNTSIMPFEDDIKQLNLIDENKNIDEFFNSALDLRNDLKYLKNLISYNKETKKAYMTDFFPKPLVSYQQQFQGTIQANVRPNYIVTGFLTWEPGKNLGYGTYTKIKSQQEKIKATNLEYENKYRNIKKNIIEAKTMSIFSNRQMTSTKNRLDYANESIRLAILRFKYHKGIFIDVIEAQDEVTKAKIDYVSNIVNYNISQARLLYEVGLINDKIILEKYNP